MYLSVRVCVSVFFCGCVSYVCGFMCIFLLVELCLFVGTFDNVMCKSLFNKFVRVFLKVFIFGRKGVYVLMWMSLSSFKRPVS